ncbi:MAG: hypothetical protein Q9160_005499 [Pyrenula sp. 1 TL-2023]
MRACFHSLLKNSISTHFGSSHWNIALLRTLNSQHRILHRNGSQRPGHSPGQRYTATAARRDRKRREAAFKNRAVDNAPNLVRIESQTASKPPTAPPKGQEKDIKAWIGILEPHLPYNLRSRALKDAVYYHEGYSGANRRLIVNILHSARLHEHGDLDVLAHLGLVEQRWAAVMWLVEYLLEESTSAGTQNKETEHLLNSVWSESTNKTSLSELCKSPIEIREYGTGRENFSNRPSLAHIVGKCTNIEDDIHNPDLPLKQIWQSMGSVAIEAANLTPDGMRSTMGWIYQILALLHARRLIPETTYRFQVSNQSSVIKRSPVIYMLSTRLLSALSETVFTKESREIPGMAYRLVGGDPYPNVWLEYILWCCIDCGFVEESSWILAQLHSSESRSEWRMVDWTGFQAFPSDLGRSSHNNVINERRDFLSQTESRTISSQVVLAIVDGLINQFRRFDDPGEALRQPFLQKRIFSLLSWLGDQDDTAPSLMILNRLLVRMRETPGYLLQLFPGSVWHVVDDIQDTRTVERRDRLSAPNLEAFASPLQLDTIMQNTDPVFGTLHQALEQFCRLGDVRRALTMFDTIQYFVDRSRRRTIDLFGQRLQSAEEQGTNSGDAANEGYFLPQGQPPLRTLGRLLDVLTFAGRFDIGRWLLYSADPDGPIINPIHYGVPQLSPALIRFAQATEDVPLVSRVLSASQMTSSVALLYSVLSLRYSFQQFDLAEDTLRTFKDTEKGSRGEVGGYRIGSLASLAAVCIRLANEQQTSNVASENLGKATSLCERIFRGDFSNFFSFGKDFQAYRKGLNLSLLRILQSFPNPLQEAAARYIPNADFKSLVLLQPSAFNIILSAVVETSGAVAGKRMYDNFCKEPTEPGSDPPQEDKMLKLMSNDVASEDPTAEEWWVSYSQPIWNEPIHQGHRTVPEDTIPFEHSIHQNGEEHQPLAKPNIWTIRMIIKATLQEIRNEDLSIEEREELQLILEWSVGVYRKFGLKISDMVHEYGPESTRRDILPRKRIAAILYGR